MKTQVLSVLAMGLSLMFVSPMDWAQKADEIAFVSPLANGGAPSCPEHTGSRTLRSETVSNGSVAAAILGSTVRDQKNSCVFSASLALSGLIDQTIQLPDPGKQTFSIVDFSRDGSKLLIASEYALDYPNEAHRDLAVAILRLPNLEPSWVNVWDVFGWYDCDATVEPQGFTLNGQVVLRARPSVMRPQRRPDCVERAGLYETDLASMPHRLPDDTKVARYGQETRQAEAPCKTDPDIVAACFSVRGRMSAYNGTPTMRIWPVGTDRILGVEEGPMPEVLEEKMNWDVEAWGSFEVCPFTRERPGRMQTVCIEKVDNPVFKDRK